MAVYLEQLAEAKARGLTREIGVSNFTVAQLKQAVEILGPGAIAHQQVEIHPLLQNRKVVEFCQAHGIAITAYMPLAYGKVLTEPLLMEIGKRHGVSAAQVSLAQMLERASEDAEDRLAALVASLEQATLDVLQREQALGAARMEQERGRLALIVALRRNYLGLVDAPVLTRLKWALGSRGRRLQSITNSVEASP